MVVSGAEDFGGRSTAESYNVHVDAGRERTREHE